MVSLPMIILAFVKIYDACGGSAPYFMFGLKAVFLAAMVLITLTILSEMSLVESIL